MCFQAPPLMDILIFLRPEVEKSRIIGYICSDSGRRMVVELANREKRTVALYSVIAGSGLTLFKIVVALLTGSLALLAEAAHSGLDLVSALTTLFAVRIAARPADRSHQFGHGKFENLSALIEMLLLLITCIWVIFEAIQRLFFQPVAINASAWAFLVMGASILIDYSRSRSLTAAAAKYNSQALEADALNYRNDMYSSLITIIGLGLVRLSQVSPSLRVLSHADSVAALGLAVVILWVGSQMGGRALGGLLDRAPDISVEKIINTVQSIPGVIDCHNVRVRASGPYVFIDAHVTMDRNMPLGEAHALMDKIELAIQRIAPGADVDLHPEPDWKARRHRG